MDLEKLRKFLIITAIVFVPALLVIVIFMYGIFSEGAKLP